MFGFNSPFHLLLLALVVLLLFGNRLPSVMRSLGQGVVEFKKGMSEIKDESKENSEKSSSEK
jgi:sec-independent protein translocase protein TatA